MPHPEFTLLGDAVWLDFVNTSRGRIPLLPISCPTPPPTPAGPGRRTSRPTSRRPFPWCASFRDQLTALAEALHAGRQPPGGAVAAVNALWRAARAPSADPHQRRLAVRFAPGRPLRALEAIARSAAATLADPATSVRRCAGETCSLFFADGSPVPGRRWCDAAVCGRRARIERRRGLLR